MNKFLCESDKKNIMNAEVKIGDENEKKLEENDESEEFTINPNSIMQKYLEKPLLLNKKKFASNKKYFLSYFLELFKQFLLLLPSQIKI